MVQDWTRAQVGSGRVTTQREDLDIFGLAVTSRLRPTKMKNTVSAIVCLMAILGPWSSQGMTQGGVAALFEQGRSYLNAGDHQKAVETFSKVLGLLEPANKDKVTVLLARAQAYYQGSELQDAWKDSTSVLRSDLAGGEAIASAHNLRGLINLKRDQPDKAVEDFTAAIKSRHSDLSLRAVSFVNRGLAYLNASKYDEAISDLNKGLELQPKSAFAYAARGLAYLRADNIDMAQKDAKRALNMNPDTKAREMAERILKELSISASGPLRVTIPLNDDGQVFVQLRFSKTGTPHRFLLDTGATFSLVSPELLTEISQETEVKKIGRGVVSVADGSRHTVTRYVVKTAFLYNLPLGQIEVHVFDTKTKGIVNLLGTRSMTNVAVSIDNLAKKVEIVRRDSSDN
ncbi:MAG: aspartyl protease family protein [Deltaproteobacteria bacterium]|nr:aspartyl protease family protein [Deltaproteobacteria bacterium]